MFGVWGGWERGAAAQPARAAAAKDATEAMTHARIPAPYRRMVEKYFSEIDVERGTEE